MELNAGSVVRVVGDVLFRNLGLKLLALGLAALLFVLTRDDVTRSFDVPVRVIEDPSRVLLTDLPSTVKVHVRGPWTRLNRLTSLDFDVATVDLRDADPGTLEIGSAAVVMPPGVVLSQIDVRPVDLRFDEVTQRPVNVVPTLVGQPATDYRFVTTRVDPKTWEIRGGATQVGQVTHLSTAPFDISGARNTISRKVLVVPPSGDVQLVGAALEAAHVEVRAVIEPLPETREVAVPVEVPEGIDPAGVVPKSYSVQLSGPLPSFRLLDALGTKLVVVAEVVPLDVEAPEGGKVVEIRFDWAELVPPELRSALSIDQRPQRVTVPPPPPPPEPDGQGAPL